MTGSLPSCASKCDATNCGIDVILHFGDLNDANFLRLVIKEISPHELYNLAAQSNVGASWDDAEYTFNVNALGIVRLLEALRSCGLSQKTRIFQVIVIRNFRA